ncbi:hypothetical protein [Arthrobacter rhombi]|uniref:hypothetical protein n=1 Tax=Arthrobacter rhombi TaxID=71253 RepID=UPI003F93F66B
MRIYVPGANRTGRAAWPHSTDEEGLYVSFPMESPVEARAATVGNLTTAEPVTVIAHSLGAIPALLAIATGHLQPARLVLLEPGALRHRQGRSGGGRAHRGDDPGPAEGRRR